MSWLVLTARANGYALNAGLLVIRAVLRCVTLACHAACSSVRDPARPPSRDSRGGGYPKYDDRRSHSRDPRDYPPSRDTRERDPRDRRSSRMSAPPPPPDEDYEDERRHGRPKQTRFADTGVSGRRYPDEPGLRRGS